MSTKMVKRVGACDQSKARRGRLALPLAIFALLCGGRLNAAELQPEISISLRGAVENTVEVGEPLFLGVRLDAPEGKTLTLPSGWANTLEVSLAASSAAASPTRATLAKKTTEAALTLDAEKAASSDWFIASTEIGKLPPGEYRIHARLGAAASEPLLVRVVAPSDTPGRQEQRTLALAAEAMAKGTPEDTARLLDAALAKDPDSHALLRARAHLCLEGGNPRAASICVNRALARATREKWRHPPAQLLDLRDIVTAALEKEPPEGTVFPAWTILPTRVAAPTPDPVPLTPPPAEAQGSAPVGTLPSRAPQPAAGPSSPPSVASTAPAIPAAPAPAAKAPAAPAPLAPLPTKPGAPSSGVLVAAAELADAAVIADARGQWAAQAASGTQYSATSYTPAEATGAPNVPRAGDNSKAWCHSGNSKTSDWLEVSFAKPVSATEVRVRQTNAPGSIVKVEAIEADGTSHLWWEGKDEAGLNASQGTILWLGVRVPKTDYAVARVRLTLNIAARVGWKQIDAVQLVEAK